MKTKKHLVVVSVAMLKNYEMRRMPLLQIQDKEFASLRGLPLGVCQPKRVAPRSVHAEKDRKTIDI